MVQKRLNLLGLLLAEFEVIFLPVQALAEVSTPPDCLSLDFSVFTLSTGHENIFLHL